MIASRLLSKSPRARYEADLTKTNRAAGGWLTFVMTMERWRTPKMLDIKPILCARWLRTGLKVTSVGKPPERREPYRPQAADSRSLTKWIAVSNPERLRVSADFDVRLATGADATAA
jgi:hypothetical protein